MTSHPPPSLVASCANSSWLLTPAPDESGTIQPCACHPPDPPVTSSHEMSRTGALNRSTPAPSLRHTDSPVTAPSFDRASLGIDRSNSCPYAKPVIRETRGYRFPGTDRL